LVWKKASFHVTGNSSRITIIFSQYPQDIGMKLGNLHKMLDKERSNSQFPFDFSNGVTATFFQKTIRGIFEIIFLACILALSFGAFTWNHESVFYDGSIYFADGDCYARMTRVRMIEESSLHSIRHHDFENYPTGTTPHTTMPMDALIVGLSQLLRPFFENHLALAGAWISPLLGLATLLFLGIWSLKERLPYRRLALFLFAISPILAQGFQVGRPDHQSLLILLVTLALASEISCRQASGRFWPYAAAMVWGIALWVSLFEPVIILALVLLSRGIVWAFACGSSGEKNSAFRWSGPVVVVFCIFFLGIFLDGWRVAAFDPAFDRWALNIGELRPASWRTLFSWCGWLLLVAPVLFLWKSFQNKNSLALLWFILLVAMIGLTHHHSRWGYFLSFIFAMCVPWFFSVIPSRILVYVVFFISLWPIAGEWESLLYPSENDTLARAEKLADAITLRQSSIYIRPLPPGGVLAPWWLCPAIVWWSGHPCIGGSSHQSLPGIVGSCEFYLSQDSEMAQKIMEKHQIRYVFSYEPERVIQNSCQILGVAAPLSPLASELYNHPKKSPAGLSLIFSNKFFKVFEQKQQNDAKRSVCYDKISSKRLAVFE